MEFEKSADTKIIESVLREAKVGQLVTYEELSKAIGRDVRVHARGSLCTARRGVSSEHGMVFGVERGVGLKRLSDSEIVASTESDRLSVMRKSKKAIGKLAKVKFSELSEDDKRQHVVSSSQFGALAMFSSKKTERKIEQRVNGSSEVLPVGETLKLFS